MHHDPDVARSRLQEDDPPRWRWALLLLPIVWFGRLSTPAQAHWIDDYLQGRGICGPGFPGLYEMMWGERRALRMSDQPDVRKLFGRAPAQWTPTDLDHLRPALSECQRVARSRGAQIYPEMSYNDIVQVVRQAANERDHARDETDARARSDREEARQATERAVRDRQAAEAERGQVVESARQETAKAEADIAAANARRDIELARQSAADARARAQRAMAEADRAKAAADRSEVEASRATTPSVPANSVDPPTKMAGTAPISPAPSTFAYSVSELLARYDAQLKQDGDSGIASCAPTGVTRACRYDDASFRRSVEAFKKLDLVNGQFRLESSFMVLVADDKVAGITIQGDRSDPMNLFALVGKVGSLVKTLEQGIAKDELQTLLTDKLGLARGDADPRIGREQVEIRPGFLVACRQAQSSESTRITCRFEPRS